jgi:ABC-type glutathione transport system ATPase component
MAAALEFNGVTKRFLAGTRGCSVHADVLREVDLSVFEGESVALVGGAGTGKSTVLFLAAGLLVPDTGVVRWFGDERRTAATARASYFFTGARSTTHASRNASGVPHIQLIDAPESLPSETISRLARWIERRRRYGDAVIVATRDASLGSHLTDRAVTLRGGRAFQSIPTGRIARVAERAVAAHSTGRTSG